MSRTHIKVQSKYLLKKPTAVDFFFNINKLFLCEKEAHLAFLSFSFCFLLVFQPIMEISLMATSIVCQTIPIATLYPLT